MLVSLSQQNFQGILALHGGEIIDSRQIDAAQIGHMNIVKTADGKIDLGFAKLPCPNTERIGTADAFIRPEAFTVLEPGNALPNSFEAVVTQNIYLGKIAVVLLDACGQTLRIEIDSSIPAEVGQTLCLAVDPNKLYIF